MSHATRLGDLHHLLCERAPAATFIAALRNYPASIDTTDPTDRDIALIINFYVDLARREKDQTLFSVLTAHLAKICVEHIGERTRFLPALRRHFGPDPSPTSDVLSCFIMFSIVAGDFDDLVNLFKSAIQQRNVAGTTDSTLMMAVRSLLKISGWLNNQLPNILMPPPEIRDSLRQNNLQIRVSEIATIIEGMIRRQTSSLGIRRRQLHMLFVIEDLCLQPLDTATKLYCDYFFLLLKHTGVRVSVRVFRITGGYEHARMPGTWDPPGGRLVDMMAVHFGQEGRSLSELLDFAYVDCWHPEEDYVSAVKREMDRLQPDVCVTMLDRVFSFLEVVVFELAPLLQIEMIHNSGFIRQCDALVPNGKPSDRRRAQFLCVDAPIPQVPFPIVQKITKTEFGFDNETYVVCVAAKQFPRRLAAEGKHELSAGFARTLAGLLERHSNMSLLLVGEEPSRIDDWFAQSGVRPDRRRVAVIEFAQDFRATLQACDLVVCPPQRGGSRGPALAITDRLPVLIFDDSDAANFVPEAHVCHDLDEFVRKVEQYIGLGPGYRETYLAASGVAPFSEAYNRDCVLRFVDAAWTAYLRGQARLRASASAGADQQG